MRIFTDFSHNYQFLLRNATGILCTVGEGSLPYLIVSLLTAERKLWLSLTGVSPLNTEREAQAMATKCQFTEYRQKEALAMATKRQSADYRE